VNKKGFSLVEMIAVLIILGVVALITLPNIIGIGKKSKQQLYEVQIKTLKDSSNILLSEYIQTLSLQNNESITFELKLLKDMDILNQEFKNPLTDNYFSDNSLITLTNNNDIFATTLFLEDTSTYSETIKYKNHIILLKGTGISENSSTTLEDNFIILDYNGKRYNSSDYTVIILNKEVMNSTYSKIKYQINVMDDEVVTTYTLSRQENCQTGICDL